MVKGRNAGMRRTSARVLLAASGAVFAASTILMFFRVEPFFTWYYALAWWPYILGASAWLELRGERTLFFADIRKFAATALLSVSLWLVFEIFNFRLNNWHYINLPPSRFQRWAGYFLSFATVLPGIAVTRDLLARTRLFGGLRVQPLREPARLYRIFVFLGVAMLAAPMLWPRYFFPLVWGGFVFLLEPRVHKAGERSFLADWEQGEAREFCLVLAAGAVCGGLWEMWNFLAGAKWEYTVPFVGDLKIFEMPVAGFLGFPPFAVECSVMGAAFFLFWKGFARTGLRRWGLVLAGVVFDLVVFAGVDRFTVASFAAGAG